MGVSELLSYTSLGDVVRKCRNLIEEDRRAARLLGIEDSDSNKIKIALYNDTGNSAYDLLGSGMIVFKDAIDILFLPRTLNIVIDTERQTFEGVNYMIPCELNIQSEIDVDILEVIGFCGINSLGIGGLVTYCIEIPDGTVVEMIRAADWLSGISDKIKRNNVSMIKIHNTNRLRVFAIQNFVDIGQIFIDKGVALGVVHSMNNYAVCLLENQKVHCWLLEQHYIPSSVNHHKVAVTNKGIYPGNEYYSEYGIYYNGNSSIIDKDMLDKLIHEANLKFEKRSKIKLWYLEGEQNGQ